MYSERQPARILLGSASSAPQTITSTGVHTYNFMYLENCRVFRLMAYVTTATVSSGSIVITFRRRPVYASSSTQSTLGTLTIPTAIAADTVYYKDITPVNMNAGDQVAFECTTAAAGGGAAGAMFYDILADFDPEVPANLTKFVLSA